MRSLLVVPSAILVLLGCSGPARAQQSVVDVAGGYAFSYITNDEGTGFPLGWFASVGGHITPILAIVGEGSGANKTESMAFSNAGLALDVTLQVKLYTFMVGPKFTSRSGPARVFGQFLVGGATLSSSGSATGTGVAASGSGSKTYFAFAPGGGVDVKASDHFGVRVFANFQLLNTSDQFGGEWGKVFQTGVGILWTAR